ncbi:MAG: DUF1887 family CARF protein [Calditrichaceae bacterium]
MRKMICLVSGQTLPNYRGIKELKPEEVVYFFTEKSKDQLETLKKVSRIQSQEHLVDFYDFEAIENLCGRLISEDPDANWILNMTGGTKIASLACYRVFQNKNFPVIYVDSENLRLIYLTEEQRRFEPFGKHFSIREIIRSHGQKVQNIRSDEFDSEIRREEIELLFKVQQFRNRKVANRFNKMCNQVSLKTIGRKETDYSMNIDKGLLKRVNGEFYFQYNDGKFEIPYRKFAGPEPEQFVLSGQWFEEYVYLLLRDSKLFDNAGLGVTIEWKLSQSINNPKNELDVVLVKNDSLYIIECKAGKVAAEDINKIKSYKNLLGGSFCIPVIVSYFQLSEAMEEKLSENKIPFFSGWENFSHLPDFIANLTPYQV